MTDKRKAAIYHSRMQLHQLIDLENLAKAAESAARTAGAFVGLFALDHAGPSPVAPGVPMLFYFDNMTRDDARSRLDYLWKATAAPDDLACVRGSDQFTFHSSKIVLRDNGHEYPEAAITVAIPKSSENSSPVFDMTDCICKSMSSAISARYALHRSRALNESGREELTAKNEQEERAEAVEIENRRIIETVKQKDKFLLGTAHDLKTPLTSITGFTEILLEESEGKLTPRQKEMLQRVNQNAARLLKMINDLLDLAKMESGRMELRLSKVRLSSITDYVTHTMAPLVKGRNLTLSVELEEGLPTLYTDEQKLTQIITNLVSNAVKFTPEGRVTIKAYLCENQAVISVSDTGIGIKQSDFEAIFEEFRQVGGQKSSNGGTGLGLAITSRLVKVLGGEIGVRSELGRGSTFTVKFPLTPAPAC
ncbi:MAG: HAMP domain-containing sensor histidine kinase [Armatimonadota bacterium]